MSSRRNTSQCEKISLLRVSNCLITASPNAVDVQAHVKSGNFFMRKPWLRTTVNVMRRHDETGRNASDHMKQNLKIVFDNLLPQWNYRAIPQYATVID